jgi:hypothetical protein
MKTNPTLLRELSALALSITLSASALSGAEAAAPQEKKEPSPAIIFTENSVGEQPGGLPCYKIKTPAATYFLEKSGAGLASLIDRDGHDWLSFNPRPGTGAGGEYRGFPNAVNQQAGNYFHAMNNGTDPSITHVDYAGTNRVTISAVSTNGLWACHYDFFPTHCTFTMTRMAPGKHYWILYEGTPGGRYEDADWWMTSAISQPQPLTKSHDGDIPAPEWIVFGAPKTPRVIFFLHHEDDSYPDRFYQMERRMTVFGFGRDGMRSFLGSVPQQFSIGLLETTNHTEISQALDRIRTAAPPQSKR